MKELIEYLKKSKVLDQYRVYVTVINIVGNTVYTTTGAYHATKLFVNGQSVYRLIEKYAKR